MSTPTSTPRKGWFDGTVNLPTIIAFVTSVVSIAYYGVDQINKLQQRVIIVEQMNVQQEDHLRRLDTSQDALRNELLGQLQRLNDKMDGILLSRDAGGFTRGNTYEPNQNRTRR